MSRRSVAAAIIAAALHLDVLAQANRSGDTATMPIVLRPARVFDGETMREGWGVRVRNDRIDAVGPVADVSAEGARTIELAGTTLTPGLIEGHSHVLLHPYNEASWDDQVAREALSLRTARAVNHLRATLNAGFTTIRDLGTEGAGYADVGLKQAIEQGVIPGPRMLVATRAIVARGSYGPKGFAPEWDVPQGAEEADGPESFARIVRSQIGKGADWVKLYADYRWGPAGGAQPTFTRELLTIGVQTAHAASTPVAAHASSVEGMRNAILAGVDTIEHGDGGTPEIYKLMVERNVALCPTLSAGHAIAQYSGWKTGTQAEPSSVARKRSIFKAALDAGVTIISGSDVGVFAHGDNARELELMVEYGMRPLDALKSATSVSARVLRLDDRIGRVKAGLMADLAAFQGNPATDIASLRRITFVMKGGTVVKSD